MGASTNPSSVVSQAGNGVQMTDSQGVTKGCSGTDGVVGGLANTDHRALYIVPPHRNPISQPMMYGDLSSGPVTMNFSSQGGVPNLFGLPAPVYAGTVLAGASNTAFTAAACGRSATAASVGKSGTKTALQDDVWPITRPNLRGRLDQFHRMLWLVPALCIALNTARWSIRGQTVP